MRHLLPDAEGGEDEVEDVVGGGFAGEVVEVAQRGVEVEQEHLVGDALVDRGGCCGKRIECSADGLMLAQVGEHAGLFFTAGSAHEGEDLFAQY